MAKVLLFIAFIVVMTYILYQVYQYAISKNQSPRKKSTLERIKKLNEEIEATKKNVAISIQQREAKVARLKEELSELNNFVEKTHQ